MNQYLFFILTCTRYIIADDLNLNLPENECPRIRRPWHELSTTERELYISGLLQLRANGNGDIDHDEFIAIASVHEDNFAPVTHKASSYLFWHGYLTYELETRIRNLGEKYKCFAMPYWDYTIEHGREANPFIFSTGLGGNGNPNDYLTVNEYTWKYSTKDYWVPFNCFAQNDKYPICSLKRSLRNGHFTIPKAEDIGNGIIRNPDFTSFAKWYATNSNPVHLFTGDPMLAGDGTPVVTSYDPIWYLFHSMVQYHQAIWTDCNEYDLIDPNDLDNHPEAYTPFCVHGQCVTPRDWPKEWLGQGLDDKMHFGGSLEEKDWSYIHRNDLTVRKLYNLAEWGIQYDLGNGDGFYEKSGVKEYCKGKLNDKWFILNENNDENDNEEMVLSSSVRSSYITTHLSYSSMFMIIFLLSVTIGCGWYVCKKENKGINDNGFYSYGAV